MKKDKPQPATSCKRSGARSVRTGLLAIGLIAAFFAVGCKTARPQGSTANWTREQAQELRQAGERLGVPVRTEGMVQFSELGATVFTAPAANLETIPATRYPEGVDLGVSYFDLPRAVSAQGSQPQTIPRGFYKLRAFADEARQVGKVGGHVQLINAEGRTVAQLPADVDILSLTLPPEAKTERTFLSLHGNPLLGSSRGLVIRICYRCSNGTVVCIEVTI